MITQISSNSENIVHKHNVLCTIWSGKLFTVVVTKITCEAWSVIMHDSISFVVFDIYAVTEIQEDCVLPYKVGFNLWPLKVKSSRMKHMRRKMFKRKKHYNGIYGHLEYMHTSKSEAKSPPIFMVSSRWRNSSRHDQHCNAKRFNLLARVFLK